MAPRNTNAPAEVVDGDGVTHTGELPTDASGKGLTDAPVVDAPVAQAEVADADEPSPQYDGPDDGMVRVKTTRAWPGRLEGEVFRIDAVGARRLVEDGRATVAADDDEGEGKAEVTANGVRVSVVADPATFEQ